MDNYLQSSGTETVHKQGLFAQRSSCSILSVRCASCRRPKGLRLMFVVEFVVLHNLSFSPLKCD